MRHRLKGRTLGRKTEHRIALFRNLTRSLITHESIITTVPKAKEIRSYVEKIVTLAKKAAVLTAAAEGKSDDEVKAMKVKVLHLRRLAMAKLGPTHGTGVYDKKDQPITDRTQDTVLKKLFNVIGPRFVDRPGGYTRILKLMKPRLGDAGNRAVIEFVRDEDTGAAAPAPVTTED